MPKATPLPSPAAPPNRRAALLVLSALPLAAAAGALASQVPAAAAPRPPDGIVMHRGWVLRDGDLERLGRA